MYNFSSRANESRGDNVPDVKMIDLTPNLANSSIAIPGLKHHQLSVLDALATKIKGIPHFPRNSSIIMIIRCKCSHEKYCYNF